MGALLSVEQSRGGLNYSLWLRGRPIQGVGLSIGKLAEQAQKFRGFIPKAQYRLLIFSQSPKFSSSLLAYRFPLY